MRLLTQAIRSFVSHSGSKNIVTPVASTFRTFCAQKAPVRNEPKHDWNRAVSDAEKIVGCVLNKFVLIKSQ